MEKINRKTALQRGLKQFFTGEPCKNGHVSVRFLAKSGKSQCLECHRLTQMRYWQKQGPEQARERSLTFQAEAARARPGASSTAMAGMVRQAEGKGSPGELTQPLSGNGNGPDQRQLIGPR